MYLQEMLPTSKNEPKTGKVIVAVPSTRLRCGMGLNGFVLKLRGCDVETAGELHQVSKLKRISCDACSMLEILQVFCLPTPRHDGNSCNVRQCCKGPV